MKQWTQRREYKALERFFMKEISRVKKPQTQGFQYPYLTPGGLYRDTLWAWDAFLWFRDA